MKRYKTKFILAMSILGSAAVLTYIGNGCSRSQSASSGLPGTSTSASTATPVTPSSGGILAADSDITVIPGAKTVSLVYSKQVVEHLSACSGLAVPSDKTWAMYETKKGAISTYGTADTITSPMMMAVASIAGEICNDLIDQEIKSGARLFTGFNMSGSILPNSSQLSDSISRMAISCWERNESSSERQLLLDMINSSVGAGEALAGRKSALMLCTSMLSSLDSLLN